MWADCGQGVQDLRRVDRLAPSTTEQTDTPVTIKSIIGRRNGDRSSY